MKILFYCSCLEPGRDGVGDYTVRLAEECATRGHACTVIALNDRHVSRGTDVTPKDVRLIRLPAAEPWPDRLAAVTRYLRLIAPDWVSWQFVAYGFHPRGFLPAALLQAAPELRGPRSHVMMHELWLGLEAGSSWRARAIGWLQRRGVLCLLDRLDPDCIHTSQAAYQYALQREGYEAGLLDLFGNVPIAAASSGQESALMHWLPAPANRPREASLVALTFGTLHPQWKPAATVEWLATTARRLGRTPALVVIGRTGGHTPAVLDAFRQQGVQVAVTGELDAASVSSLLRSADLGIAVHPWELIGKSGAATAMLEHGLPVLVPRDDWTLRGSPAYSRGAGNSLLTRLTGLDADRTDRWLATRRTPASALPDVADRFLKTLEVALEYSGAPSR